MTKDTILDQRSLEAALKDLPQWSSAEGAITRVYQTDGWRGSMLVAGAIAFICEAADHHADVLVTWPKVAVTLSTHSAGGVTAKDVEVALLIERQVTWRPAADSALRPPEKPFVS